MPFSFTLALEVHLVKLLLTTEQLIVGLLMADELERTWREAMVAYFKVISR
jgi:hypothetical protein